MPTANRHNLPLSLTAFVGRETELAALADLLADPACRLLTLVGPGGIGKTRLAVQAAAEQLDTFANGVVVVPLAPLGSADLLVPAIADALDFTLTGRDSPQTQLLDYLAGKELLLILDNCEHLLAGAGLFEDILRRAPDVTLLATSRERLNVPGEWLFDVQGLPVPDHWDNAADQTAVALFMQSVRRQFNSFVPTEADSSAVVSICRLVGGMPLAIELAAGWVRILSCAEIAREIEHSLGILAGKQPGLPLRHQSLQAVYEHSWKLLTVEERGAFMRLSVFRGGFQREAVEQVAGADLRLLAALIDKSLVGAGPTGRYQLHELARQFAWEKLDQARAVTDTANRHLAYFVAIGEQAAPELIGPRQATWLDRLEAEHDNLREALVWSHKATKVDLGMRLTGALWRFWFLRGHLVEADQSLRRVLEQRDAAPALRAAVLAGASFIAEFRGEYAQAGVWAEESLALARAEGDLRLMAFALSLMGDFYHLRSDNKRAVPLLSDAVASARASGDQWVLAFTLAQAAQLSDDQTGMASAAALAAESVALARLVGDQWLLAFTLFRLGNLATGRGDYKTARQLHQEGLSIRRELGDRLGMAYALLGLANAARGQGDITEARARMEERLALERDLNNREGIVHALSNMGWMDLELEDYDRAAARFEESLALSLDAAYKWGIADQLKALGLVALARGDCDQARVRLEESLVLCRQLDYKVDIARVVASLGRVAYQKSEFETAKLLFAESTVGFQHAGNKYGTALSLAGLGNVLAAEHEPERAARLWGAASGVCEDILDVMTRPERQDFDVRLSTVQVALGEASFASAWAEGRLMTPEQALEWVVACRLPGECNSLVSN